MSEIKGAYCVCKSCHRPPVGSLGLIGDGGGSKAERFAGSTESREHPEHASRDPWRTLAQAERSAAHAEMSFARAEESVARAEKSFAYEEKSIAREEKSIAREEKTVVNEEKSIAYAEKSFAHEEISIAHAEMSVAHVEGGKHGRGRACAYVMEGFSGIIQHKKNTNKCKGEKNVKFKINDFTIPDVRKTIDLRRQG